MRQINDERLQILVFLLLKPLLLGNKLQRQFTKTGVLMLVRKSLSLLVVLVSVALLNANKSFAYNDTVATVPACLGNQGQPIPVNNEAVIQMKLNTPNSFLARAMVSGVVTKIYGDQTCHRHFSLQIGSMPGQSIEVIYNEEFGGFPAFGVGSKVVACGDYITSNKQTQYPASPDGAIIHWVHKAPHPERHPSGFLVINGILTGNSIGGGNTKCGGKN